MEEVDKSTGVDDVRPEMKKGKVSRLFRLRLIKSGIIQNVINFINCINRSGKSMCY
jgi:hypothetical protein